MSQNLNLVRSIYVDWADPNFEYVFVGAPTPGRVTGLTESSQTFRDWRALADFGLGE